MKLLTPRQIWLWAGAMALAMCWDRAVYLHLSAHDEAAKQAVESHWLYRPFYMLGEVWIWIAVAVAVVMVGLVEKANDRRGAGDAGRRGLYVLASAALAGGLAELGKLVFRRLRPITTDGWYEFRSFLDGPLNSSGVGLPSSHVAVAFGGAVALAMLRPSRTAMYLILPVGTAAARVLPGAHFLSDCVMGVFFALVSARLVYPWILGRLRQVPFRVPSSHDHA